MYHLQDFDIVPVIRMWFAYTAFCIVIHGIRKAFTKWFPLPCAVHPPYYNPPTTRDECLESYGSLQVYTGPMFCGKTTRLLEEITKYADLSCCGQPLLINHVSDNRDTVNIVSSHGSQFHGVSSKVVVVTTHYLRDIDVSQYFVVGIDECQFYPDLAETVELWVEQGKHVYCAGLDGDWNRKKFKDGKVGDLVHLAETFVKMPAICTKCLEHAPRPIIPSRLGHASFTGKMSGCKDQVEIGGSNIYASLCRRHHVQACMNV